MRLGLESEGWRVALANDIDPDKAEIYRANFPDADEHLVLGDIHQLSPDCIPTVGLATASFPCNDLSLAGGREGLKGKNSSAFWGFVRILEGMGERRPPLVLIENVVGFLSSHGGRDLAEALRALNGLGYAVDPFIMDAEWFVPQSRKRLFVAGVRSEKSATSLLMAESKLRPPALEKFIDAHPDIDWRLRSLPAPPDKRARLGEMLEDLPDDAEEWWSADRADYLFGQMSARHRAEAETMMASARGSYGTIFRRVRKGVSMAELRTDGVAGCLRTPRGGSGRQILFKAGHGRFQVRLLTPRECARLMGAGDFKIECTRTRALFGFGDAVCVPVIEWIARHYLNPLWTEQGGSSRARGRGPKHPVVAD